MSGLNISFRIQAIDDFTRVMKDLDKQMKEAINAAGELGKAVSAAGIAVSAGLGFAAKKAMDFEAQMSSVKSVMSPDEVAKFGGTLEKLAIQMGEKTKYSAIEAAQGIEELIKAGVGVTDIVNGGLEGALTLATAGELELAEAAEIASTALNAFRDDGLSVTDAANILAGAANASATSVREMQFGLSQVSAVASGLGLSFKDTSTALAVFANNGLRGSDAGTSLKTMLSNLVPKSEDAYETMRELGIIAKDGSNAFFDAQGNVRSMAEIAGVLQTALQGLNAEQRQQALYTMFGSDAIRAANILYKEGAQGIEQMWAAMSKVTAADVAAEKMNNLKGRIEELKGAMETASINIGNALLPIISVLVAGLQKLVDWFNNLSPEMQTIITITAAVAAGLMLIAGPLLIIIGFLPNIIAGFSMIAGALGISAGALAGFLGIATGVVAGITVLGATLYAYREHIKAFGKSVVSALSKVKSVMQDVFGWIGAVVGPVIDEAIIRFKQLGSTVLSALHGDFNALLEVVKFIIPTIIGILVGGIPGLIISASKFLPAIAQGISSNSDKIYNAIEAVFDGITDFLNNEFPKLVNTGVQLLTSLINGVTQAIPKIIPVVFQAINAFISAIVNALPVLIEAGVQILTSILTGIAQTLPTLTQSAVTIITTLLNTITQNLPLIITTGIDVLLSIINGIIQALPNLTNAAITIITAIIGVILQNITVIIGAGIKILMAIIEGIIQVLPALIDAVILLVTSIVEMIIQNLPLIIDAGIKILLAVIDGIIQMLPQLINAAIMLIMKITEALIQNLPKIIDAGIKILNALIDGIIRVLPLLISAALKLILAIASAIIANLPKIIDAGVRILNALIKGIISMVGTLVSSVKEKIANKIKSTIEDVDLFSVGKNIIQGLINGISSLAGSIMEKAREIANSVKNTIEKALDINSPSRVMMELGQFTGEGFALGLNQTLRDINVTADRLAYAAIPSVEPSNYSAGGSTTIQQPINITLNYSGSGSPADAYQIVDILERELGNRLGNRLRLSGVKG
jgi:TP901 family phage tail tape measure protein